MHRIIIAVDGVSSSGKSTLAKDVAKKLNFVYIDTGAMYRAATLLAIQNHLIKNETVNNNLIPLLKKNEIKFKTENNVRTLWLNEVNVEYDIRTLEVSEKVSLISKIPAVREILVEKQRKMSQLSNVILDGRDIGTVVFPNADVKFFITASIEVRVQRRYDELIQRGDNVTLLEIQENIKKRDFIDCTREISPLRQAPDAILIDNSNLNRQQQLDIALQYIEDKVPGLSL